MTPRSTAPIFFIYCSPRAPGELNRQRRRNIAEVTMSGQALHPLDAMRAAPEHHDVLMENDRVRVLDTRLGPGERTPVHTHQWPAVLYILSWSDFVRYDAEGNVLLDSRSMAAGAAAGTSLWAGPLVPHSVHNVGGNALHVIAVEMKEF